MNRKLTHEFNNSIVGEASGEDTIVTNFFISDLHYGDEGIRRFFKRPFESTDIMDSFMTNILKDLIDLKNKDIPHNMRSNLKIKNVLWILGDFAHDNARFEFVKQKVEELKSDKIINELNLIIGNHDLLTEDKYRKAGFDKVFNSAFIRESDYMHGNESNICNFNSNRNGTLLIHDPACYNIFVKDEFLLHGHVHFGKISSNVYNEDLEYPSDIVNFSKIKNVSIEPWFTEIMKSVRINFLEDKNNKMVSCIIDTESLNYLHRSVGYIEFLTSLLKKEEKSDEKQSFYWIK